MCKVDDPSTVLLVLDTHDPSACRSRLVEEEVGGREIKDKRFLFVLNKTSTSFHLYTLPLSLEFSERPSDA